MSETIKKKPNETTISYYKRLKDMVANGEVDLERSGICSLLFNGAEYTADHSRKTCRALDLVLEADEFILEGFVSRNDSDETPIPQKVTTEINKDGSQSSNRLVEMSEEESKNAKFLLLVHGYDPRAWELVSARSSIWNAQTKDGQVRSLYSSKIQVKPASNAIDYKRVAEHFEKLAATYKPQNTAPTQYEYGAEILIPCYYDIHFSKLALEDSLGGAYNHNIAKSRMIDSTKKYISRLSGRKFEKIIFAIGQDYFNSEPSGSTSHGTPQDNSGLYTEMFTKGVEALVEVIDLWSKVAPVSVILVAGNHARHTEFFSACVLKAWYRNSENVTVDDSPAPRKYIKFGKNLIGFTHSSDEKDRIYSLMCHESPYWSETHTHEFLVGHTHTEAVTEKHGVVVRRIPSMCNNDAWHKRAGWTGAKKRTMAFIYDKEMGMSETHYINI